MQRSANQMMQCCPHCPPGVRELVGVEKWPILNLHHDVEGAVMVSKLLGETGSFVRPSVGHVVA